MRLHGFFNSSTSYRVRIALALKGLDYEAVPVNLRAGAPPAHRRLSPIGAVPVLEDAPDTVLTQSVAILRYLDARHPQPPLYPRDRLQCARVEEIVQLVACDIHPLNNPRVLRQLEQRFGADAAQLRDWYAHWVGEGLRAVEQLLQRHGGEGPYCFGDTPTAADCCLVPQVANALRQGCAIDALERVMEIHRHCLRQPAFAAAAPERQPDYLAP